MHFWRYFYKKSLPFGNKSRNLRYLDKTLFVNINSAKKNNETQQFLISINPLVNITELEKLCDLVGWARRLPQKIQLAITNSFLIITLSIKDSNSQNQLIGFVRAISDQTFNATIWDMVIHPKFQNQGLGTILMQQTIQELRYIEIDTITLFADSQNIKFYDRLGFITDPGETKGMFWYAQ